MLTKKSEAPLEDRKVVVIGICVEEGKAELLIDNDDIVTVPAELIMQAMPGETLDVEQLTSEGPLCLDIASRNSDVISFAVATCCSVEKMKLFIYVNPNIFSLISILRGISWKSLTGSTDDDWIDRANHLWTVSILLLFAVVVSSGQFVGDPIHCWCPAEFTGAYVSYTKNYCWISNTYYIHMETKTPKETVAQAELNYYQWVPLILVFMAFLFKAPNIIWHLLNTKSGINLSKINELTDSVHVGKPEEYDESLKHTAKYIDRWLRQNWNYHRNMKVKVIQRISNLFFLCCKRRDGYFLTGFYLFVKLLYCVNCAGQFFLLDSFLAMDFGGYGFEILSHFREHGEWKETLRFPLVTHCDFKVRQLGSIVTFTVQCVLPINLFNEKIFAMIWFWIFFLSILTFYNLATWLFFLIFRHNKVSFVQKYLRACNEIQSGFDKKLSRRFANDYLREDGCFLLRIVGKNSTDILLSDLMRLLWIMFKKKPLQSRQNIRDYDDDDMPVNDFSSSSASSTPKNVTETSV